MNFYKRFVADIQVKTGHLTPAEFGIYDRLLDHYYATEALLPNLERCCAIARAMTKADREATARVLAEFFTAEEGGLYSQRRADEMIAEAQPKIAAAKANGLRGGRPKQTQQKPSGLANGTQEEPNAKASQNQNKTSSLRSEEEKARKRVARPAEVDEQTWLDWLDLRKAKRAPVTETTVKEACAEAAKAGLTLTRFLAVWCARGSQGLQAEWLRPDERATGETSYQRSMREIATEIHPAIARAAPGAQKQNPMEVLDGLVRIAG